MLDLKSKNAKTIVYSILAGVVCAFMDALGHCFAISVDMEVLLGDRLSIVMYTDSKQLCNAMTKEKHTTKRRL